ncbi:MAG: hypothetical protein CL608_27590 [Anaerolineaceae bacterium]|nr:hypothetical protein [Anaerolineaceae bacterium]
MNDKNLSKNVKSVALVLFVINVVLVAIINSSSVVPWIIIGFVILAVGLLLQRSEKFADFREQIVNALNSIRRGKDLNEKEKFHRKVWLAIPMTVVVLFSSKNPFFAGAIFVVIIWDGIRHLRKWQRLQDEEKP